MNETKLTQMAMNLSIKLKRTGSLFKEIYIDNDLLNEDYYGATTV